MTCVYILANYLLGFGLSISWLASVIHKGFSGPLRWSTPVHCSSNDPVEFLPFRGDKASQLLGDCSTCPCCWDIFGLTTHLEQTRTLISLHSTKVQETNGTEIPAELLTHHYFLAHSPNTILYVNYFRVNKSVEIVRH